MSKLLEFQKRVHAIAKDSTNPFFKSNYFDINKLLEEVKPILSELGLVINQPLTNIDGKPALKTVLISSKDDGTVTKIYEETVPLIENPDPQKMGAIITYFRRYALQSLLALQAEDNDANEVSQSNLPTKRL